MDLLPIIERRGFTVTSLARRMNMAQSNLYKLVQSGNPTLKSLKRMAEAMDISLLELLGKDKAANKKPARKRIIPPDAICGGVVKLGGKRYRQLYIPMEDKSADTEE